MNTEDWSVARLTTLSRKGQVTIPRRFLRQLGLYPQDALLLQPGRSTLKLVPVRQHTEQGEKTTSL